MVILKSFSYLHNNQIVAISEESCAIIGMLLFFLYCELQPKRTAPGEQKKFKKNCSLFCSENFLFCHKIWFSRKSIIYLFYYNAAFKYRTLFKWIQSSIGIDVTAVKRQMTLNFVEKYERSWKKESECCYNYYYWICLNIPK